MTMATAYLSRGSQDLAFKQLSMAIKKAPTYSDIYIMRGQVYIQLGQFDLAVDDFLKVGIELDPGE
jgi:Tfp pilus assembly protein PilF